MAGGADSSSNVPITVTKRLAEFPKEYTYVAVSDPRPSAQFLLSLAPSRPMSVVGRNNMISSLTDIST